MANKDYIHVRCNDFDKKMMKSMCDLYDVSQGELIRKMLLSVYANVCEGKECCLDKYLFRKGDVVKVFNGIDD